MTLRRVSRGWVIPDAHPSLVIQAPDDGAKNDAKGQLICCHRGSGSRKARRPEAAQGRILSEATTRTLKKENGEIRASHPSAPQYSTQLYLEIFQIREKGLLKAPKLMKTRSEERDRKCYYHFHRDYDHDTKECYDLKNQIEYLICRGHLDRFIRKPGKPSLHLKGPVERQIDLIVGSLTMGGDSSSARKAYARVEV
ncbi:hypothetical protein BHM03_00024306 [Ensete ventricosum]|nr:hypothetical protein BHM03_00024306 [Ensete ventricosum]